MTVKYMLHCSRDTRISVLEADDYQEKSELAIEDTCGEKNAVGAVILKLGRGNLWADTPGSSPHFFNASHAPSHHIYIHDQPNT